MNGGETQGGLAAQIQRAHKAGSRPAAGPHKQKTTHGEEGAQGSEAERAPAVQTGSGEDGGPGGEASDEAMALARG